MKTDKFKKGQWLISKTRRNGEVDLCVFNKHYNRDHFLDYLHIRILNDSVDYDFAQGTPNLYINKAKSIQWRLAKKAELKKYSQLIFS